MIKQNLNMYDILKYHMICYFTLLFITLILQLVYCISNIIILSIHSYDSLNKYIWTYNFISIICISINIILCGVFHKIYNYKFKIIKVLMCIFNFILFISGIVIINIYNSINDLSIICIIGIIIQLITGSLYLGILYAK